MIPIHKVGQVFDDLDPFLCKAKAISETNKKAKLLELANNNDVDSLVKM
jgi:hypothetical protein